MVRYLSLQTKHLPFQRLCNSSTRLKTMHEPNPGISKKLQGILVHEVLANLWGDLESLEIQNQKIYELTSDFD